jgi:hypothetical protein
VTAAVQGRRAGEMLDDATHEAQVIASLNAAGVLVPLPNAQVEAAAAQAVAAYAAGAGDAVANALMNAGFVRGVGGVAAKGRKVLWSNQDGADAKSWADVMSIVALSPLGPDVAVWARPDSAQVDIPAGSYDFRHGKFFSGFVGGGGNGVNLHGAHLKDVSMSVGVQLHFASGHSTLEWTPTDPGNVLVLLLMFGGALQNDEGPLAIPIRIPNGDNPLIIGGILGGGIAPGNPVVSLGPGAILWTITINSTTGSVVGAGTVVSDDASAILIHAHDGSFAGFPSNPGFLGTQLNVPLDNDGGSGPTSARPNAALFGGILPTGWKYYDTTIDKPIVVNAANAWVDYAGNPV